MEASQRERLYFVAKTIVALLLVGAAIQWVVTRPKPQRQLTLYIGDPSTACAYPFETLNVKKLTWKDQDGQPHSWEEFQSLEAAKSAGYRLCH